MGSGSRERVRECKSIKCSLPYSESGVMRDVNLKLKTKYLVLLKA